MRGLHLILIATALASTPALAGPCTDDIAATAKQLGLHQAKSVPNAYPTVGAPDSQQDLQRARQLDANNDPACHDALRAARRALGEPTEGQPNGMHTPGASK